MTHCDKQMTCEPTTQLKDGVITITMLLELCVNLLLFKNVLFHSLLFT